MNHLNIWKQVETTDPLHAKDFTRGGGFSGTAINPTYLAKKATELFGPVGIGWGMNILDEKYVEGGPIIVNNAVVGREVIHVVRCALWYIWEDKKGEVIQFGQTTFVGKNSRGPFTDEEAPKKSLTDAMSKCLSLLGFSADIHTGQWDANKYINQPSSDEFLGAPAEKAQTKAAQTALPNQAQKEVPVNLDLEKATAASWEARIAAVTQMQDLENAERMLDGTFKDPSLREHIKKLITDRKSALVI